ncbi:MULTISPECIES: hypothetical protein [Paracoccus]|uniref:Uncharacterized protein n=1 Tax=Paracoccus litorisediminis TaxID=2006130 RepID=A0A844HYW4_9RHOB|nr:MULTISPECIES: hypothetical protein [Paracoccus]MBD9529995.1 hypothetical protein [Paracoccus sp. PAR01]MTH62641.1 hypothetical protein [Paracoccus litorisediminis]
MNQFIPRAARASLRISITFGSGFDLNPAVRRGIETAILTPAEAETAVWIDDRLTYRTRRSPEEVMIDWELHGYDRSDFLNVQIGPWVMRRHNQSWTGRNRRIHRQ